MSAGKYLIKPNSFEVFDHLHVQNYYIQILCAMRVEAQIL